MLSILSSVCWQSVYLLWRNVYLGLPPCYLVFFTPGWLLDLHSILFCSAATRIWLCNQYSAFIFLLSVNYLSGAIKLGHVYLPVKPTAYHILHATLHRSTMSEPQHHHVTAVLISSFSKKWLNFPVGGFNPWMEIATALKRRGCAVEEMHIAHSPLLSPKLVSRTIQCQAI